MGNATIVNFASGETSPKSRGRFDIPSYNSSCRKMENFIAEVSGAARYRPGFKHLTEPRIGTDTRIIPFQFSDTQAYMLEFTVGSHFTWVDPLPGVAPVVAPAGVMRVIRDGEIVTKQTTTITSVESSAELGFIIQTADTGLAVQDTIVISGVVGATWLNGRQWYIAYVSDNYALLADPETGYIVDATALAAYVSGGTVSVIYEAATPYTQEGDLEHLFFSQTVGVMHLAHYNYPPQKVTPDAVGNWVVGTYSRTADPFVAGDAVTITGVSKEASGIVTFSYASSTLATATHVISAVVGMTELNGNEYRFAPIWDPGGPIRAFLLDAVTEANIDTSGFTTYESGGEAAPVADRPVCPAFYESRLVFAGTNLRPSTLFLSRSPSSVGASRFDDFTGGTDADHACFFSLAPVAGTVDYIAWAGGTSKYLIVGTFGGAFRVSGGGLDEPITPSSINVKQLDAFGCAATAPALNGTQAYFIQRGGKTLRAVQYAVDADDFTTTDMCLNAEHIGESELKRVVFQANRPDALWVVRADGQLAGLSIQGTERISGWHRHKIGGTAAKVLDVGVLPRPGINDQLYVVTERTIGGVTRRAVEAMADDVFFPDIEDYFTASTASATDAASYRAAALAVLKTAVHLDAYEVYNGVPATVISGIDHLEGETVTAVADGVEVTGLTVTNGAITLTDAASIVVVGLPYTGRLQTQNLEVGGRSGPAQAKPRNINALNIRFLNSKGGQYGTDLYHLYDIETEDPDALELADGSAAPVFNGIRALQHSDVWSTETDRNEKTVFIQQARPFPCVVQFIDIEYETGDE